MKIGIFDSGIGGLTVLRQIVKKYPNLQYYYFGDNLNAPYGSKDKKELINLSNRIIKFLETKEIDILIIACGTISSTILNKLRSKALIYDIISPTINYLNQQPYQNIGVIATTNTINSNIFNKKLKHNVISKACPSLVPLIENSLSVSQCLNDYLKQLKNKIDILVLGCTHYPIIEKDIKNILKKDIMLIDMGNILADSLNIDSKTTFKARLYFSKIDHNLISNIDKIIDFNYSLEEVVLEE